MRKEYEIIVTYKCNWNCSYCCVDTHSREEVEKKVVFNKIKKIEEGSKVYVTGGEPGTLSQDYLEEIFLKLKEKGCLLGLNTNGLFLSRYPELLKYISDVNYHCSEDLDLKIPILTFENLKYPVKIDYLLIVHDENEHKLQAFLNYYPEITFNVVPASTPGSGILEAPELSNEHKYAVLRKFHNRLTTESKKRLLKEKDFSQIIYL